MRCPRPGSARGSAEAAPFALTTGLVTLAQQEEAELLATLESHADGLSPHEAEERLATLGPNEVDHENRCRGGATCGSATAIRSTCC